VFTQLDDGRQGPHLGSRPLGLTHYFDIPKV
jgi:hypothetical protein